MKVSRIIPLIYRLHHRNNFLVGKNFKLNKYVLYKDKLWTEYSLILHQKVQLVILKRSRYGRFLYVVLNVQTNRLDLSNIE